MKGSHSAMLSPRRTMRSRGNSRSSSGVTGLLYPLLVACLWAEVVGYKPVVIVHGLFDSSGDFKNLLRFINQVSDPGDGARLAFDFLIHNYYCCCFCWPRVVNSAGLTDCVTAISARRGTAALEHRVKIRHNQSVCYGRNIVFRIWRCGIFICSTGGNVLV